ncbi:MAG: AbrB/MazE/SpoVT family DNA-binding domain-containing protein [Candidatus Njordarchaeota archaeon]
MSEIEDLKKVRRSSNIRSILRLGKSSYVITLPHDWLRMMNLKRGDRILLVTNQDGSLALYPMSSQVAPEISLILNVDSDRIHERGLLERILVGSYLEGIKRVLFKSTKGEDERFERLKQIAAKLINTIHKEKPEGLEFEFRPHFDTDFTNLVVRLSASLLSMVAYIKRAIMGQTEFLKHIETMENEIDRDYWWALRILVASQINRSLALNLGFKNPTNIIGNRAIIRALELAGDYVYEIAMDLKDIAGASMSIPKEAADRIASAIDKCEDIISHSIYALHALDPLRANENLNEAYDLRNYLKKLCLELSDLIEDRKLLIYMVRITSRLIDVVESVSTLNEVIINRCLGSEDTISRFKYLELKKQAL